MATQGRTADSDVRQPILSGEIRQTPWEFQFFQCVRWLHRIQSHRSQIGRFNPPHREVLRFHANPSPAFPASQLFKLEWPEEGAVQLTVNFMGLFGPMGVLPLYYSEYIVARHRARDRGLSAFLDMFNHRMISLFYQAWEKYRFYVAYERAERDRLSQYLLDLIGLGTVGLQHRQDVRDDALLFYSGLLSLLPRSALGLQQVLSDFFDVPVQVEQFVGAWYPLEKNSICKFNRGDSYAEQLGVGAIVGDEVWDPQSGVRVRVGPLTLQQYLDFLPNGSGYKPLKALTRFYTNGELSFEVQLVLKRGEVPSSELGALGDAGPRLGWVTWVKSAPMNRDPDETVLKI